LTLFTGPVFADDGAKKLLDTARLLRFTDEDTTLAILEGELDLHSAPRIQAQLLDCVQSGGSVRLDVRGLWFCDSSGLRLLFEAAAAAQEAGTDLSLHHPSPTLRTLLDLVDAKKVLRIAG
jgi:anti-anti-sigma factor